MKRFFRLRTPLDGLLFLKKTVCIRIFKDDTHDWFVRLIWPSFQNAELQASTVKRAEKHTNVSGTRQIFSSLIRANSCENKTSTFTKNFSDWEKKYFSGPKIIVQFTR